MILLFDFFPNRFRSKKVFQQHFSIDHQFHGVKNHLISESYIIHPKSSLAIQLFHEGVQFPSIDLHLQCKIIKDWDQLRIELNVSNPAISKEIIKEIQQDLVSQLNRYQQIVETDPRLNYIQSFCEECNLQNTKPFNVCIKNCEYNQRDQYE